MGKLNRVVGGLLALALALALGSAGLAVAAPPVTLKPYLAAAVVDPHRPASDVALDATRRGPEILAFSGIQPGWRAIDLMQGAGYYTRLFIAAAGPKGKVYAWSPDEFVAVKKALYGDSLEALTKEYAGRLTPLRSTFDAINLPDRLDLVFTSQNYHDMHLTKYPAGLADQMNRAVFKALRPGGVYLVVDHVGNAGDATAPNRVHRIDPAFLRREVEAAGFVFDGESDALRNPADDHTKGVFDPTLRGRTDQLIYRFRKPKP
ncbi:class I SAM-dependent methyltransferase [soil metagenome]